MEYLSIACHMNNLAVERLQAADFAETAILLQKALTMIKSQLEDSRGEKANQNSPPKTLLSIQSGPSLSKLLSQKHMLDQSIVAMFDRAFVVEEPGEDDELLVAIILYNMALLKHITSTSNASLQRSLHLYHIVLQVLEKSIQNSLPGALDLLLMGTYNNMAQIYEQNFCEYETLRSMQAILDMLSEERVVGSVAQEDYDLFQLNIVMLKTNAVAAPAA